MAITQVSNSLVKQDLTISGGTVDNTVIGSGTPAAGTFTTITGTLASTVTGTTAAASDNSTKVATTAYVTTALANLVDSAPGTLNTLNELAAALGDDASFSTTVTNSIATKLPLAGGTMTGAIAHSGNFSIDAAGDIHLDADSEAIRIRHDGGDIGIIQMTSNDLILRSMVSDKDLIFKGNDGGSVITALTLDMSEAGKAVFGGRVQPNEHIIFGSATGYLQFAAASSRAWAIASHGGTASPGTSSATFGFHHWSGSAWSNPINITASGKLGVGTDNPDDLVHLKQSSGTTIVKTEVASNSAVGFEIKKTGSTTQNWRIVDGQTVNGQFEIYDITDSALRLAIGGSGLVGIGRTPAYSQLEIQANKTLANNLHIQMNGASNTNKQMILGYDTDQDKSYIISQVAGSATKPLVLTASLVGIGTGTTTPKGLLHVKEADSGMGSANGNFDKLVLEDSSHSGMTILGGANTHGAIYFGDPDTNDVGQIKYQHNDDSLRLTTNSQERLRIDSGGQMRFGKSINFMDSTVTSSKFWLAKSRDILGGTDDHAVYYTESGIHHQFWLGGVRRVNIINDGITFGTSTGTVDTLNDFEEGTWTPSFTAGGHTVTQVNFARYTKIKNFVQCICYVSIGGTGNGANLTLAGLPFSVTTNAFGVGVSDMEYQPVGTYIRAQSSTSQAIFLVAQGSSTGRSVIIGTQINVGYGIFNFSYYTA